MDRTVLSFHDSLLRASDVVLLDGCSWLNDKIIGFYFEYLEYNVFREYTDRVCFITPDVTQLIKLYEGPEHSIFLEPLNLHKRELIILAVNNNQSTEAAGGSHWSTLVYDRKLNTFHHLDSLPLNNSTHARQCASKITPFLKASSQPKFEELDNCPRQDNGYDCGVYALCFVEAMCKVKLLGEPEADVLQSITRDSVKKWRTDTKHLISVIGK